MKLLVQKKILRYNFNHLYLIGFANFEIENEIFHEQLSFIEPKFAYFKIAKK